MLKSLELKNFRGFQDHRVEFAPFSLLIGQNNAGKTTLIEALRIISLAQRRAPTANFVMGPRSVESEVTGPMFPVSLASIGFEHSSVHHRYDRESPAIIRARMKNNCQVTVVIGSEHNDVFCQLQEPGGKKVNNRNISSNPKFGRVLVMPPIGHLLEHEAPLSAAYMKQNMVGYRAHRHIRNQMYEAPNDFKTFRSIIEDSWTQLQVSDPALVNLIDGVEYQISVRDGPFVSELGRQGSGLQAWFQTIWFLARAQQQSVVVLDEPDVYLHADLQRKLLKIIGSLNHNQTIIATHSIEMISDVSYDEIILIKKRDKVSKPLKSNVETQSAIEQLGTLQNLQLSKLAASGTVLFLEGKDRSLLSEIAYKMGPRIFDKLSAIPSFPVGGFNNWRRAALSAKAFHEHSSGRVKSYMILDRDYKPPSEVDKVCIEASQENLNVICWTKKEIENYLIDPKLLKRVISGLSNGTLTESRIDEIFDLVVEELADELQAQVAEAIRSDDRKIDIPNAMKKAKALIEARKAAGQEFWDMVSGKEFIGRLSSLCQGEANVSLNAMAICRAMTEKEIDAELAAVIRKVCA